MATIAQIKEQINVASIAFYEFDDNITTNEETGEETTWVRAFDGEKRISIMAAKPVVDKIKENPAFGGLHLKYNGKKTPKDKEPYHSYVLTIAENSYAVL